MRKKITLKICGNFRALIVYLLFGCLLSLIIPAGPAYGIRLTHVKHLFDLTHDFSQPSDVSVSKDGLIYVVDGVNSKIKVFNQEGRYLFSFGERGSRPGEFRFPLGIGIDNSGRVYIADSGNRRVQIFSPRGDFIHQINLPLKYENPAEPTDVVVDKEGRTCYVVDNNNHYILAYDLSSFKNTGTYGKPGSEKLEFSYPFLITRDNDNYLYITDVINTRVQVLNSEGKFVNFIGGWGVKKGEFFRPKGVAVDKNNRLFVSDSYMGVIQVFNTKGEFYSALGDPGKRTVKKFKTPTGIFIDGRNRLYVVEMFVNKVSVYSIEGDSE